MTRVEIVFALTHTPLRSWPRALKCKQLSTNHIYSFYYILSVAVVRVVTWLMTIVSIQSQRLCCVLTCDLWMLQFHSVISFHNKDYSTHVYYSLPDVCRRVVLYFAFSRLVSCAPRHSLEILQRIVASREIYCYLDITISVTLLNYLFTMCKIRSGVK